MRRTHNDRHSITVDRRRLVAEPCCLDVASEKGYPIVRVHCALLSSDASARYADTTVSMGGPRPRGRR